MPATGWRGSHPNVGPGLGWQVPVQEVSNKNQASLRHLASKKSLLRARKILDPSSFAPSRRVSFTAVDLSETRGAALCLASEISP